MCTPTSTNFTKKIDDIVFPTDKNYIMSAATVRDDMGNEDYIYFIIAKDGLTRLKSISEYVGALFETAVGKRQQETDQNLFSVLNSKFYQDSAGNYIGFNAKVVKIRKDVNQILNLANTGDLPLAEALSQIDGLAQQIGITKDELMLQIEYLNQIKQQAAMYGYSTAEFIIQPSNVTITKPTQSAIDAIHANKDNFYLTDSNSKDFYAEIPLVDLINDGNDIVIHTCMVANFKK